MKLANLLAASLTALVCTGAAAAPAADLAPAPKTPTVALSAGDKILAEIDRRAAVFRDREYGASMAIYADGHLKKTLEFTMLAKGLSKQFLTFSAPGDVAGMKVLMEDADTLYLYLPEFKKVRRVAAHLQNQGFLGSTFTYEDMTQAQLAPFFTAELVGREGTETTLRLTAKSTKTTYPHVDIVIDSTKGGVTYFGTLTGRTASCGSRHVPIGWRSRAS